MRRYLVFGVVGLTLFMASVAGTTVSVAFPTIIAELHASLALSGWVLSVYQLMAIGTMPLIARMSDGFGRKRVFIGCTILFTGGSLLSAFAPNVHLLILARAVQAIGGGGFLPSATGIVSEEFPEARQRSIGLFTSIFPIGAIVGPNLGGWMVAALGWKSVFWFNVPIGVAVLVASFMLLRNDAARGGRIDFTGAALLMVSLTAFMIGLTLLGDRQSGLGWEIVAVLFAVAVVMMYVFLRWERRQKDPLINLEILRRRPFMAANLYNFIFGACAFGIFMLIPLYAVSVYGLTTLQSGLILTPRSIGMMAASTVVSFLLVRWGYRKPIIIGTVVVAAGLLLLSLEPQALTFGGLALGPMALLLLLMTVSGLGVGMSAPAANNACIELMPDRVATITGLRGMFRNMGGALSIALATLVIESSADVSHAFFVIFIALAVVMLASVPFVFMMPARPEPNGVKPRPGRSA